MSRKTRVTTCLTMGAFGVALLATGTASSAQELVINGLNNPRGLDFAPNGDLYIAEAGTGGGPDAPCFPGPGGGTACPGLTGGIAVLRKNGELERPAQLLYSAANESGNQADGPADVAAVGARNVVATIGLATDPNYRETLRTQGIDGFAGQLVRKSGNSAVRALADVAQHEADMNPAGGPLDSNPYGLFHNRDRDVFLVADAAANALLEVHPDYIRTVAVFESSPNPLPFGPPLYEAVPTDVTQGPDGSYYVSEFTGFPFPQGAAKIHRVLSNGAKKVWATGFSNIISIAASNSGMYVLEFASNGLLNGPFGSLIYVPWNNPNSRTVIAAGLFAAGGVAVAPDQSVYVSVNSVLASAGAILRYQPE